MRSLAAPIAVCLAVALVPPAVALPRGAPEAGAGVVAVENRLLPRLFGGGEEKRRAESDTTMRIDQLEAQVRSLTGQVEELTFTVRQLQAALAGQGGLAGQPAQRSEAAPGPGATPRNLGTLPADTAVAASNPPQGPIDLSAINTPASDPALAPRSTAGDPLASVREMQATGRYARAAEEARAVLASNPRGAVASEARYLLGEALLSQGDYREAANLFLENYTTDPNGSRAPESLLKLGTALNGLGESEAACSSLEELFGAYPNIDPQVRAAAEEERRTANCV
jgi:tol-pal system protein YbgF